MTVHGLIDVQVIEAERDPSTKKAFLRLTVPDGTTIDITLNLAATIGGIAQGAITRFGYDKDRTTR